MTLTVVIIPNSNVTVVDVGVADEFPLVGYNRTLSCRNGHLASLDLLAIHSDHTGSTVALLTVVRNFDSSSVGHSLDRLTNHRFNSFAVDRYLFIVLWSSRQSLIFAWSKLVIILEGITKASENFEGCFGQPSSLRKDCEGSGRIDQDDQ